MTHRKTIHNGQTRFIVEHTIGGRRKRKFFKTEIEAQDYCAMQATLDRHSTNRVLSANYTLKQLADIASAMQALPHGQSLTEAVKRAFAMDASVDLHAALDEFFEQKKSAELHRVQLQVTDCRLKQFKAAFFSFGEITPAAIIKFLRGLKHNGLPMSGKTISHWRGLLHSFFAFCIRRDYCALNPMDKITRDDLPRIIRPQVGFLSVPDTQALMAWLEAHRPQFVRFYALALFAGIRIAEIPRMTPQNILTAERKIIMPRAIVKTQDAWTLETLPNNLWAWLDKYPELRAPTMTQRNLMPKQSGVAMPHNFARHSFATYHLSLYHDPQRTAMITRHRSTQTLQNHYFGALVSKDLAARYFEIRPL